MKSHKDISSHYNYLVFRPSQAMTEGLINTYGQ